MFLQPKIPGETVHLLSQKKMKNENDEVWCLLAQKIIVKEWASRKSSATTRNFTSFSLARRAKRCLFAKLMTP